MAIDPYVYPGTNVLRNLAGIQDYDQLQQFEAVSTAHRISELRFTPIAGVLDTNHLKQIHQHIFQDVYAWAGEFRNVDIQKENVWFCRWEFIERSLLALFGNLKAENKLLDLLPYQFGLRAGYYMTELNAIHPFREGNGRAQREFIRTLGINAGLRVDWASASREEVYSASVVGFDKGDCRPMGDLIARITTPL